MSIDAMLMRGRAMAEKLHTDTFTVRRTTGETTTDPDTLEEVPVYATVHTDIAGKFKGVGGQNRAVQTPGVQLAETTPEWHTSVTVLGILTDDIVECTAVDPVTGDPDLVGVTVRITGPFLQSKATARRFKVQEISDRKSTRLTSSP